MSYLLTYVTDEEPDEVTSVTETSFETIEEAQEAARQEANELIAYVNEGEPKELHYQEYDVLNWKRANKTLPVRVYVPEIGYTFMIRKDAA